jgi:hypothetical protein
MITDLLLNVSLMAFLRLAQADELSPRAERGCMSVISPADSLANGDWSLVVTNRGRP